MGHPGLVYEDFQQYFPFTPTALAIKECARLHALRQHECTGPILDVGCGDGLFAKIAFSGEEIWGIDINAKEGRWAMASAAYRQIILGDVTRAHLPAGFFASCVANCSLEHVPDVRAALDNIYTSLRPGCEAFLFVPNRDWASHFLSVRALRKVGGPQLASRLQDAIDQFFVHRHLYDQGGWRELVLAAGFEEVSIEPVLSTGTTVAFELFLLPSLAGWLNKRLTTRWTNFPGWRRRGARLIFQLVKLALACGDETPTAEFLVRVRRPAGVAR